MIEAADVYSKPVAEMALLHALMFEPGPAKKSIFRIDPELFHSQVNRKIFVKMRELYAAGKSVDLAVLDSQLVGIEINYLVEITRAMGYMAMCDQYLTEMVEAKKRRELYVFAKTITTAAGDPMLEVADIVGKIRNFSATFRQSEREQTLVEALMEAYNEMFNRDPDRFCRTGIESIDAKIGGFEPGTLTIIGARPSVGKSIIGMQIMMHNAQKGKKVLFINREMMKKNFGSRMVSNYIGLESETIKRGAVDEVAIQKFLDAIAGISELPVSVLNYPSKPSEIRGAVIERMEEGGLDLLVIDYLQRVMPDGRYKQRNEAIGSITWALKDIAMTYKIPVVLLSQLNRDASNKRPSCANLRDSGDIEQDADTVLLLHRPNIDEVPVKSEELFRWCEENKLAYTEAIIDKNREGATATAPLIRDAQHMKFIQPGGEERVKAAKQG